MIKYAAFIFTKLSWQVYFPCPCFSFMCKNLKDIFLRYEESSFIFWLENTPDWFACPWNSTLSIILLWKMQFSNPKISFYVKDHNSQTKALMKKVRTCCPSPWSTLANDMSIHVCKAPLFVEKLRNKWRLSISLFCFIIKRIS